jgi:pimeloyl-ACP methyl ester carboxylesterase
MSVKEWYLHDTTLRFDPEKDDKQMIQWFADLVGGTDPDVMQAIVRFLPDVDVSNLCPRIKVPTLILHPGQSPIAPVEEAQAMHQAIPNSRLVVYEDASHHIFLTRSEDCAHAMLRFLQGLS